jgi:hypothetical protein
MKIKKNAVNRNRAVSIPEVESVDKNFKGAIKIFKHKRKNGYKR